MTTVLQPISSSLSTRASSSSRAESSGGVRSGDASAVRCGACRTLKTDSNLGNISKFDAHLREAAANRLNSIAAPNTITSLRVIPISRSERGMWRLVTRKVYRLPSNPRAPAIDFCTDRVASSKPPKPECAHG